MTRIEPTVTAAAKKKRRVAAYCRVSTGTDDQLVSLEVQKAHYEEYISGNPEWEYAGIYYDEGITGTKKEKRPALMRMGAHKGNTASFHPKLWLIRYRDKDGGRLYRLAGLSRNLTFDRSWDVTFYMDGAIGERTDKNVPLCDFLSFLAMQLPEDEVGVQKGTLIRSMIEELPEVLFQLPKKEGFEDYAFFPGGIPGGGYRFTETELFTEGFR
ncbi:MAG: recombinase family protein, partial [Blautia sp.]|nr:recombinase family protein [Blautia sp.]